VRKIAGKGLFRRGMGKRVKKCRRTDRIKQKI
jgi:hypothetical protein